MPLENNNVVALSGCGTVSAVGSSTQESWQNICALAVPSHQVPSWLFNTHLNYPVFTGPKQCLTDSALTFLTSAYPLFDRNSVSRTILLALSAVAEALIQANISLAELQHKRLGIAIGTTVGPTFNDGEYFSSWRDGKAPGLGPVNYYLAGNIASAIHRILRTTGPAVVVTNACASGTDAIGLAKDWLANDICDYALAGGADELSRVSYNGFASLMLMDEHCCRPFDRQRNGLNLGEGAGVFFMETVVSAHKRKQPVLGVIKGYGSASDAWHPTAPHPEGRGLVRALQVAFCEAEIDPAEVALVNAHGTGTKTNDLAETTALAKFVDVRGTAIVSTKGATGHTLGAAGGIEAIFTLMALNEGYTKGTIGCHNVDEQFLVAPLNQMEERELSTRYGITQSLAFGGGNSVLIMEACS